MIELIAEIGINHGGDVALARQLIEAAAQAGANTVKFQCHMREEAQWERMPEQITRNILGALLTEDDDRQLKAHAESLGLRYLSTPFCVEAVERLERLGVERYKVGSGEVTNIPMLKAIGKTGKPVLMSLGLAVELDVWCALTALGRGCDVTLMHCVSEYPTKPEHANLGAIAGMRFRYGRPVGYSDHSDGIALSLAAAALGVVAIERHFRLHNQFCADEEVSLDPTQFRDMGRAIREIEAGLKLSGVDSDGVKSWAMHGLVAARDMHPGHTVSSLDLYACRPLGSRQVPASAYSWCIGRTVDVLLRAGDPIEKCGCLE